MLDSTILQTIISSTTGESFTLVNTLSIIISSIILGLVISLVYIKTNKKNGKLVGFAGGLENKDILLKLETLWTQ